jgi:hypothetical protein
MTTVATSRPRFITTKTCIIPQRRTPAAHFAGLRGCQRLMRQPMKISGATSSSLEMGDVSEDDLATIREEPDSQVDWRRAWYVILPLWRAWLSRQEHWLLFGGDEVVLP